MAVASPESPYPNYPLRAPSSSSLLSRIMDKFDRYFDRREQREASINVGKITEKLLEDRHEATQEKWARQLAFQIIDAGGINREVFEQLRTKPDRDWLAVLEKLPQKQKYIDQYASLIQLEKKNKRD